jgi:hypothetical protein
MNKDFIMKTSLKLLLASMALLSLAYGQEPTQALTKQVSSAQAAKDVVVVSGVPQTAAPVIEPKALPPMNPPLGDIARLARASHAAAPKALVVVETDTAEQKDEQKEEQKAADDKPQASSATPALEPSRPAASHHD